MTDIMERHFKPSVYAAESPVGEEIVILHLKQGIYYGLDVVGARVWTLLKLGLSPAEICRALEDEYDAPAATIESDVRHLLDELTAKEMIVDA